MREIINIPMEPEFNVEFLKSNSEFLDLNIIFHFNEKKCVQAISTESACLEHSER